MKNLLLYILVVAGAILTSCDLDVQPTHKLTSEVLFGLDGGVESATNGNYLLLKETQGFRGEGPNSNNTYVRHLYQMSEFAADNVMYTQFSSDPLYIVFKRNHLPSQQNSAYFWNQAYKINLGATLIIEKLAAGESDELDHILGENYFLRAMAQFDLLKFFAQPHTHGAGALGIILRTTSSGSALKTRSTVGEGYDQVIEDLEMASTLMEKGSSRGAAYASKEAAWALLSRVYLYMENHAKTIEYSDKVIASNLRLATNAEYLDNFANSENSPESIFIIKHTDLPEDNKGKNGSIGSMYYDDGQGGGWGEVFVSQPFLDLIQQYPEDIRNDLIIIPGNSKNGFPIRYITKFSGQDGIVNLASPQYLRLSEVYLNRAEAYAKTNNNADALTDVNVIRMRAGLTGTALYTASNLGGKSVLEVVLEERRLELAYEGHRSFDLFRNKIDLDRSYEGIHLEEGKTTQVIPFNHARNIFFIPDNEIFNNPDCEQNP